MAANRRPVENCSARAGSMVRVCRRSFSLRLMCLEPWAGEGGKGCSGESTCQHDACRPCVCCVQANIQTKSPWKNEKAHSNRIVIEMSKGLVIWGKEGTHCAGDQSTCMTLGVMNPLVNEDAHVLCFHSQPSLGCQGMPEYIWV